jgi:NTP pyrophosphatase (non-canonical NTP hydrolase)
MEVNYYQTEAHKTAIYPEGQVGLLYLALGLSGEAGEVADKVKKLIRDGDYMKTGRMDLQTRESILKEISDTFWYQAELCTTLGVSMQEVMEMNLAKLKSRQERGVLGGSGDER